MASSLLLPAAKRASPQQFTLNVVLPIVAGAAIYTLWRSQMLLVFRFYDFIGLGGVIENARIMAAPGRHLLPKPLLYSLPDALWVYSYTACSRYIWLEDRSARTLFWVILPLLLACGAEIGQGLHLVRGIFDLMDLAAYILASLLAIAVTTDMRGLGR